MIVGVIVVTISFLLEGLLSSFLPFAIGHLFLFKPMFTIVSLILSYPYFNRNEASFYKLAVVFGLLYDIIYTNTFPLYFFLFLLIAFFIRYIFSILASNSINMIIMTVALIILFEILNSIILNLITYTSISVSAFLFKIGHSCLLNIIYVLIGHIVLIKISQKYKIRRID